MVVKCVAKTCVHNKNGICASNLIEMVDFEYYSDAEKERREIIDDDIKCDTYKSIYGGQ